VSVTTNIHIKPDDRIQVRFGLTYTAVWINSDATLLAAAMDGWTPELVAEWLENIAARVREGVQ
jgi:uncharacterized protein (DUF4213/DUF364 family)